MPHFRFIVLTTTFAFVNAQKYALSQDFSGSTFFQGFKYNASAIDTNNFGNVHFVDQATAIASNMTFIDSSGRAIITVDNTTSGLGNPSFGRNSVYLESNNLMDIGSLLIFDANHIPFGCSVWPSLFTQGQNWPAQGEIDIVENVNLATVNRYSLHAGASSCVQPTSAASNQTGTTITTNCTVVPLEDINTGCVVQETQSNSFGSGFASQGGGVYAMQWNTDGISMWFFERANVPSDVSASNNSPDPSTWPEPSAFYPPSGCDPTAAFGPQIITIYIDICGAFAGEASVFASTCSNVAQNCTSLVQDPTNYANAYWEINYLRVFTTGNSSSNSSSSGGGSSSGTGSGSGSGSGGGSSATAVVAGQGILLISLAAVLLGSIAMI